MEKTFKIGEILKPQGVKGELKVKPLTDNAQRFKKIKKVYIDNLVYTITGAKITPESVIIGLSGINDRNTAELFRGKFLHVDRENATPLEKDRYYIADLVGCLLFENGSQIGEITEITSARTDVITATSINGGVIRFPFLKDAVVKIDVENKIFEVDSKRFKEIALYED